jgi:2,3-bisphosphoglycerate-independent phosphoglycerate mutase
MNDINRPRPVVLCILDGWGVRENPRDNAVAQASTPIWDDLLASCIHGTLEASEESVGLPKGQFGNSEVGHMNIGAGRVLYQDLLRIDAACEDGSLGDILTLVGFIQKLKESGGVCHLMGLVSPGGVHAHQNHIAALIRAVTTAGVPVAVHAFLDGRDTAPLTAKDYISELIAATKDCPGLRFGSVCGRFYAMDRDSRWGRVTAAYEAIMEGRGKRVADVISAISASYDVAVTDEFVVPTVIGNYGGMKEGDGILMANYRADRVREILMALLYPHFEGFERTRTAHFAAALGMTEYSPRLNKYLDAMFSTPHYENIMAWVVCCAGMKQLRIAETEKYAHVTYFFNVSNEQQFEGEDRILIPSPRVPTYDVQPEMAAPEVTRRLIEAIEGGKYGFIVVNFANPDMVGHTGSMSAAVQAVETIDTCLGRLVSALHKAGGAMLITADHGNIELMRDPKTGQPHTSHTCNPVPSVLVGGPADVTSLRHGCLADIAPTLLALMGLDTPKEMTGHSLLVTASENAGAKLASA